jgi:hypothetical protein
MLSISPLSADFHSPCLFPQHPHPSPPTHPHLHTHRCGRRRRLLLASEQRRVAFAAQSGTLSVQRMNACEQLAETKRVGGLHALSVGKVDRWIDRDDVGARDRETSVVKQGDLDGTIASVCEGRETRDEPSLQHNFKHTNTHTSPADTTSTANPSHVIIPLNPACARRCAERTRFGTIRRAHATWL